MLTGAIQKSIKNINDVNDNNEANIDDIKISIGISEGLVRALWIKSASSIVFYEKLNKEKLELWKEKGKVKENGYYILNTLVYVNSKNKSKS